MARYWNWSGSCALFRFDYDFRKARHMFVRYISMVLRHTWKFRFVDCRRRAIRAQKCTRAVTSMCS